MRGERKVLIAFSAARVSIIREIIKLLGIMDGNANLKKREEGSKTLNLNATGVQISPL